MRDQVAQRFFGGAWERLQGRCDLFQVSDHAGPTTPHPGFGSSLGKTVWVVRSRAEKLPSDPKRSKPLRRKGSHLIQNKTLSKTV